MKPRFTTNCVTICLLCGVLVLVGCSKEQPTNTTNNNAKPVDSAPQSGGAKKKIVFVFKVGGISYSEACKAGADQANEDPALNADVSYQASTEGTAVQQQNIIEQAIVGHADAIVVSPVNAKAIVPALDKAAAAGIQVFTWDADAPDSKRKFYVAAVDDVQIGADIADALAKSVDSTGKVLIFSGQRTAQNLNNHVEGMEIGFKKYPRIKVASPYYYNDDDKGKSVGLAVTALQANPDAVGIACANSVSPPAAGEALSKLNLVGKVKVWGLALPSETATYLKNGSVTGLYLWDPKQLTYLTAKLVKDALDGKMPQDGQELPGVPGKLSVKGSVVTLPLRLEINKDNVDHLKFLNLTPGHCKGRWGPIPISACDSERPPLESEGRRGERSCLKVSRTSTGSHVKENEFMSRFADYLTLPLTVAALAACLWLCPASSADGTTAADPMEAADQKIIAEERDHSQVLDNLEYLSDMIGPRLTGSDRLTLASNWTLQKMKEYGLSNAHLEPYTIPRGWVRGVVTAHIGEPNGLPVALAQMAWTPGTHGRITGSVVTMKVDKEEDLAAYKGRLHGAFVVLGRVPDAPEKAGALPLPDQKSPEPIPAFGGAPAPAANAPYTPPSMSDYRKYMELRKKIMDFAKAEGVAGVLMDSSKPYFLLNMTGSWTSNSTLPTFFVAHENMLMMERLLHRNQPVTLELSSTARFTHGPITVYNTVGDIPGTNKPDEIVLLGGHLNSWDLGTGSTDNGTGCMAVLEAARALKATGLKPARTLRFVMFTGEEEGLIGSKAYVEAHKQEMNHYDVVFVHDTGTGRVKGAWLQERAECKPLLAQQFDLLTTLGLVTDSPNLLPGKMNGTDHASFDDAGVPAFAFNQDEANYGLNHHSQADTFDKVRPDDLKQGAAVLAILGYNAAEMPDRYPRVPAKTP